MPHGFNQPMIKNGLVGLYFFPARFNQPRGKEKAMPENKNEKRKVPIQVRIDSDDLDELLKNSMTDVAAQAVVIAVRTYNRLKAREEA